ncbi:MAG: DNA polymerase III subunit alpha [Clostridia bacterium]|nr:DNA polymerase III subunit alpha [Clostridia bacterium]
MIDFTHLHVHTEYSLLDGASRIKDIIKKCKQFGMDSIAITDHGVMYGVIEFYKQAVNNGIKPIIGCEVYMAKRSMHDKESKQDSEYSHLVLLAENNTGYKNLVKIVSKACLEGFYYKPRVDTQLLSQYNEGIIALSACLAGDVQKAILSDDMDKAEKLALTYNKIFGEGNFYLELQDHGLQEQKMVNSQLIGLSEKLNIPLVATNDVHYINKEDASAHDVLLCIQTGRTVDEKDRLKFDTDEFYLKSQQEMQELFRYAPTALENTKQIAQRCNVEFEFNKLYLPEFKAPKSNSLEYLTELCYKGLEKKYDEITPEVKERLEYELGIIHQMGYVDYFLIVWDFIRFAKSKGIMVGPGRGSAAGSIVAYCLDITNIDPVKYNLLFERFLNPERVTMPDIDIDFCYERRSEVIDYVIGKYGSDHVAQIITFGTMAARAVIRDVGRALNMPYAQVDYIAKQIPFEIGMNIEKALKVNPKLDEMYHQDQEIKKLIDMSKKLEGLPRHASTHAAGVVISKMPIMEYVPLQKNDDIVTTQFSMGILEELGLLKMDFLGLRTLTVIRDTLNIIKSVHGKKIDLNNISLEDPKVFELIGSGETDGVFQLESSGMKQFMKELNPDKFEDIIAGISLYRPGPMDQIPRYIENKKHPKNINYTDAALEPILKVTYGCMVYQEQVMQIVRDLAGYSLGRSDLVRRAMAKKKTDIMERERKNFIYGNADSKEDIIIKGAVNNGVSEENANRIFDEMMEFAKYAFNKSHAAAYALIAYHTAWLKCYYPVEFMAALMTSVMHNTNKIANYINNCKTMGISILPPDVNESFGNFTVVDNKIRFGLAAVKNVGSNAIDEIVRIRKKDGPYKSFVDFCERVDYKYINKKAIESLIKCGAFDSMGVYRSQLMAIYEKTIDSVQQSRRRNIDGQLSLFESQTEQLNHGMLPDINEYPQKLMLSMEKEILGIYISGHPLSEYKYELKKLTTTNSYMLSSLAEESEHDENISNVTNIRDRDIVTIGGIIVEKRTKATKNNEIMCFIGLEDLYGVTEVVIFPRVYNQYMQILDNDSIVLIKGMIDLKEGEQPKILCRYVEPLYKIDNKRLYLKISNTIQKDVSKKIKPILKRYSGNIPVFIYIERNNKSKMAKRNLWVSEDQQLMRELKALLGEESVKLCK